MQKRSLGLALVAVVSPFVGIAFLDAQVIRVLEGHGLSCRTEFVGTSAIGFQVTTCESEGHWVPAGEALQEVKDVTPLHSCEAKRDSGIVLDTATMQCQWARPAISFASAGTNG